MRVPAISQQVIFIFLLLLIIGIPADAAGANWEDLFEAKTPEAHISVKLNRPTLRSKTGRGEFSIAFSLRTEVKGTAEAKLVRKDADYEVLCESQRPFELRSKTRIETADGKTLETTNPNKYLLEGKEYNDFKGVMDLLCSRQRARNHSR